MATILGAKCEKAEIKYPLFWDYRVILKAENSAKDKISNELKGENFKIEFSKFSKNGKFMSFNVGVFVNDETHKNSVFTKLQAISEIIL